MKSYWPFGFTKPCNGLLIDESSLSLTLDSNKLAFVQTPSIIGSVSTVKLITCIAHHWLTMRNIEHKLGLPQIHVVNVTEEGPGIYEMDGKQYILHIPAHSWLSGRRFSSTLTNWQTPLFCEVELTNSSDLSRYILKGSCYSWIDFDMLD